MLDAQISAHTAEICDSIFTKCTVKNACPSLVEVTHLMYYWPASHTRATKAGAAGLAWNVSQLPLY